MKFRRLLGVLALFSFAAYMFYSKNILQLAQSMGDSSLFFPNFIIFIFIVPLASLIAGLWWVIA